MGGIVGGALGIAGGIIGGGKKVEAERAAQAGLTAAQARFSPFIKFGREAIEGGPITGETIADQPGYQFRFRQGMQALERGFAARGQLLSGRAGKGFMRFGQGLAATSLAAERGYQMQRAGLGVQAAGGAAGLQTQIAASEVRKGEAKAAPWDILSGIGGGLFGANMPVGNLGGGTTGGGGMVGRIFGGGMAGMT